MMTNIPTAIMVSIFITKSNMFLFFENISSSSSPLIEKNEVMIAIGAIMVYSAGKINHKVMCSSNK